MLMIMTKNIISQLKIINYSRPSEELLDYTEIAHQQEEKILIEDLILGDIKLRSCYYL